MLPIIITHVNNSDYLPYVLAQAKHYNPQSDVILLGDASNNCYQFVEHENIFDYLQEGQDLFNSYKHYSANSLKFELFCFQRWFAIKNFLLAQNIQQCLHLDSDILLYTNVTEEQKKFADYDFTLSLGMSPHCTFINNVKAIEDFCNFIIDIYTDISKYEQLQKQSPGGICDMTAFVEFIKTKKYKIGETADITNDSKYDHNINLSEGFDIKEEMKNIVFIDDKPFCKHLEIDREIKFNTLHFQGYFTKKYIKDYYRGGNLIQKTQQWRVNSYEYISNELDRNYVDLELNFRTINLIIFPDWLQSEAVISLNLEPAIKAIALHPECNQIALIIHIDNIDYDDANIIVSSVIMNLLLQEDLEVMDELEIGLFNPLGKMEWEAILPRLQGRIILENEDDDRIMALRGSHLSMLNLDSFKDINFNFLQTN